MNHPYVIITGCSGLIGQRLVESLVFDHRVVGLDRETPKRKPSEPGADETSGFSFVECDLTENDSVDAAIGRIRSEHGTHVKSVIHLAAYYDFSGASSPLYQDLTIDGTRRLLAALENELTVEQFVFSSSLLVMEPRAPEDGPITEDSPTRAEWAYPRSKIKAEEIIRDRPGSIPSVILRIAGVYDEHCHSLPLSRQIQRIYEKRLEGRFFPGEAEHGQPFIHVDDLVDCIRRVIARCRDLQPYEVFLVAEPEVMSYAELQKELGERIHGQAWPSIRIPKIAAKAGAWAREKIASVREGESEPFIKPWMIDIADDHYAADVTRMSRVLDFRPQRRLRDHLDGFIAFLAEDPKRFYEQHDLPEPDEFAKVEGQQVSVTDR